VKERIDLTRKKAVIGDSCLVIGKNKTLPADHDFEF